MSKYAGARSHASQVAADHRSRVAAGNAARLAAAGLALFLTFGFGGVAQAAPDQAPKQAQEQAQDAGVAGTAGTTPAAGAGPADPGPADKPADKKAGNGTEVIEISAVSTDATAATQVTATTVDGVTTTETTTVPMREDDRVVTSADAAVGTLVARAANEHASESAGEHANEDAGTVPESQLRVEHCHKNGKVIVISENGTRGHETGGHYDGGTDFLPCADSVVIDPVPVTGGETVPVPVTGGGIDPVPVTGGGTVPVPVTGGESVPVPVTGGETVPVPVIGGESAPDVDVTPPEEDDLPEVVVPAPSPDDSVESPEPGVPGKLINDGKQSGPDVLGEESERPHGSKPGQGGPTVVGVVKMPGGRLPLQPEAIRDDPSRGDKVLDQVAERSGKNRPPALLLPDTGAGSNLAAQAGAGLVMLLGGALTLRSRRRGGES
ncbi:MAG TPA: LPXTG cell wall anchor domain-containing protein [Nocardioidaceae bacterium]|nr:LPXTG cell wall anchor domain-containing protein [Nocardioidaceae bacterium]